MTVLTVFDLGYISRKGEAKSIEQLEELLTQLNDDINFIKKLVKDNEWQRIDTDYNALFVLSKDTDVEATSNKLEDMGIDYIFIPEIPAHQTLQEAKETIDKNGEKTSENPRAAIFEAGSLELFPRIVFRDDPSTFRELLEGDPHDIGLYEKVDDVTSKLRDITNEEIIKEGDKIFEESEQEPLDMMAKQIYSYDNEKLFEKLRTAFGLSNEVEKEDVRMVPKYNIMARLLVGFHNIRKRDMNQFLKLKKNLEVYVSVKGKLSAIPTFILNDYDPKLPPKIENEILQRAKEEGVDVDSNINDNPMYG